MQRTDIQEAVLAAVSEVTEFPAEALATQLEADLVADLGIDSLKVMEIWVALETRLGLDLGDVSVAQLSTMRAVVDRLERKLG